ncbi:MAG: hypothetical protein SV583_06130 [Pseudomonadota bacterium]|nr:hypothetical protein [Pseudomonadota bacterium]
MLISVLNWTASLTGILGALMVSLNAGARVTGYGFLVFSLSSLVWVVTGTAQQEIALVVQYLVLLAINLFGVYRWLVKNGK